MRKTRILYFLAVVMVLFSVVPENGVTQSAPEDHQETGTRPNREHRTYNPVPVSPETQRVNVVLLLDCSGTMKQIDPSDERKPAAKLFISLLDADDAISIIGYGDTTRELAPLIKNSPENREKLFSGIDNITTKEFNTNLTEAIQKAYEKLKPLSDGRRIIVVLSNGLLDLGSSSLNEKAHKELKQLLPPIAQAGIVIHSISFAELMDMSLLTEIATATQGTATIAKNSKDLHVLFASLFEKIKSPDSLPLKGDSFSIDSSIQEAILLITKTPGTKIMLTDPSKAKHAREHCPPHITWHEENVFDMITIKKPAVGTWRIDLSTLEGNKIYVLTDLKLKSSFNRDFAEPGETFDIEAWFEKDGFVIREPKILDQIAVYMEMIEPDGKKSMIPVSNKKISGSMPDKNGIFFGTAGVLLPGIYQIAIKAEGKTFQREKTYHVRVFEPGTPAAAVQKHAAAKRCQESAVMTPPVDWKHVLMLFGIINGALFLTGVIGFMVYRMLKKRKTRLQARKEQKSQSLSPEESKP
ncbi:MAG: vWA domain-containing protein [Nitrospirota bacterium]